MTRALRAIRRSLQRLVRIWRCWRRAWMAYRQPLRFAEWVNSERASVTVWNDPSGRWNVQFGNIVPASTGATLGEAMCHQCLMLDATEEWCWTSEFLPPNAPRSATGENHEGGDHD